MKAGLILLTVALVLLVRRGHLGRLLRFLVRTMCRASEDDSPKDSKWPSTWWHRLLWKCETAGIVLGATVGIVVLLRFKDHVHLREAHDGPIRSLAYSRDGRLLLSHGDDGTFRLWDAAAGKALWTQGNDEELADVALSPDGKAVALATKYQLRLFDVDSRAPRQDVFCCVERIDFVPRSDWLGLSDARAVGRWKPGRPIEETELLFECDATVTAMAANPAGAQLAIGTGNRVIVWDIDNRRLVHSFRTKEYDSDPGTVHAVSFSLDGMSLACASGEPFLPIYDEEALEPRCSNPDGCFSQVTLWDTKTGILRWTLRHGKEGPAYDVCFSGDGKKLAVCGRSSRARYNEDGDRCVTGGIVRVLDVATGKELETRAHSGGDVQAVAFCPTEEIITWGADDGRLVVQPLTGKMAPWPVHLAIVTVVGVAVALLGQQFRNKPDSPASAPSPRLEEARARAAEYLRQKHEECGALVESHYPLPDLDADILHSIVTAKRIRTVQKRAKAIAEKIDRFRAYEVVREAYRQLAEPRGGSFPYSLIEQDLQALLDPKRSAHHVRAGERELLSRIDKLSRVYRERATAGDNVGEQPVHSLADIEAAIAREVRSEALPDDGEEDIEREIAHRLRRLRSTDA